LQAKHRILVAMSASMVLGYLPWYNFSAVLKYIAGDLHFNSSDTGLIISVFQVGYVAVVLFSGWLADRIGTKKVLAGATLLTAVFSALFAVLGQGLVSTLLLRLATGAACGGIYAPGMALLSNWFPPNERGRALGAYTGALVAAYAGGYFVAGPVAASYGWRTGVMVTSVPVFVAFLIILFFVKDNPREANALQFDGALNPAGVYHAPRGGWGGPALVSMAYMGHMWELYAFWGWVGPFMIAASASAGRSLQDAASLGTLLAAIVVLIGAPASLLWGMAADKIGRTKSIVIAAVFSLVANLGFGYLFGRSLVVVVAVGLWIGFWVIADSAIYKAALTDMVEPRVRTTVLGVQSAVGYSMTIFAPIIFGRILQHYNGNANPTEATVWGPAFLVLGLGALVAPTLTLVLRRHPQAVLLGGGRR
jgi:MFS family permease